MTIPFTQFLMPNGRQVSVTIERPDSLAPLVSELLERKVRFEIEMLSTGLISMEAMRDEESLAAEICPNGPEVLLAVDRMIRAAHAALKHELAPDPNPARK